MKAALYVPFLVVTSIAVERLVLGASEDSNDGGFHVSLGPCFLDVHDPCNERKVVFYLYTRELQDSPIELSVSDAGIPEEYDVTAKTKILIHGYAGSVDHHGMTAVRKGNGFPDFIAYHEKETHNVIVVDWSELVKLPCYPISVVNTVQAGRCTAQLLSNLASFYDADPEDFHAIGFSLGAHVAAFASNEFERIRGKRFGRISGLDPALPFFASLQDSWKLDKEDALFVDVVHTNVGVFGKIEASGHVDFYLNRAINQPACDQSPNIPLCSHNMAPIYYAESITASDDMGFWGTQCSSYFEIVTGTCETQDNGTRRALMGERCDRNSRGRYFVMTRDKPPYALGRNPNGVA